MMHIGDEAMFEALVDELRASRSRRRSPRSAPLRTSPRRATASRAIDRIGFPVDRGGGCRTVPGGARCARRQRRSCPCDDPVLDCSGCRRRGRRGRRRGRRQPGVELAAPHLRACGPRPDRRPLRQAPGRHRADARPGPLRRGPADPRADACVGTPGGPARAASGALAAALGCARASPRRDARRRLVPRMERPPGALPRQRGVHAREPLDAPRRRDRRDVVAGLARALDAHARDTGWATVFHAHWGSLRRASSAR